MCTVKLRVRGLMLLGACALAGCVAARDTESQGESAFLAGGPTASLDYGAGGAGGAGGAAGTGSDVAGGAPASMAGIGSPPPNPIAGTGGGGPPETGMTSGGVGGTMANSGGAGGVAGMIGLSTGGGGGDPGSAASGGASGAAGAGAPTIGTLTLKFTSAGNGGEYAPRNVGAVWIETSSGQFVKTLERWAGIRANHLTKWTSASGGWGGGFFFATGGNTADQMDAISGATLRTHQMHMPTWNMKDAMGMVVPDGTYRVMIEVTESERVESAVAAIEFDKGPAPVSMSPADKSPFKGLTLSYTP